LTGSDEMETRDVGDFQPKIIGFLCNWCAYAGADLAGVSRIEYPDSIRILKVMCSGRVDPTIIMESFISGVDGVLICGCHPGECQYLTGNLEEERKVELVKRFLDKIGIDKERLRLEWIGAWEGRKFANIVTEFTNDLTQLGANPMSSNGSKTVGDQRDNMLKGAKAAKRALEDFRLRSVVARERKLTETGNVYGEILSDDELASSLEKMVEQEFIRGMIVNSVRKEPKTILEISKEVGLPSPEVYNHVTWLWKTRLLVPVGEKDYAPLFTATGGA